MDVRPKSAGAHRAVTGVPGVPAFRRGSTFIPIETEGRWPGYRIGGTVAGLRPAPQGPRRLPAASVLTDPERRDGRSAVAGRGCYLGCSRHPRALLRVPNGCMPHPRPGPLAPRDFGAGSHPPRSHEQDSSMANPKCCRSHGDSGDNGSLHEEMHCPPDLPGDTRHSTISDADLDLLSTAGDRFVVDNRPCRCAGAGDRRCRDTGARRAAAAQTSKPR